jgi:hypothetical protein
MDGSMGGWQMDGWMDESVNGWIDKQMDGKIDQWIINKRTIYTQRMIR